MICDSFITDMVAAVGCEPMLINGAIEMTGDSFITDMVAAVGYESMI